MKKSMQYLVSEHKRSDDQIRLIQIIDLSQYQAYTNHFKGTGHHAPVKEERGLPGWGQLSQVFYPTLESTL